MLGSPVLGTAVGLVLLFAVTALLCSGVTETLSNILQLRAKYLLTGMRVLLDAPAPTKERRRKERKNTVHERVKDPEKTEKAVKDLRRAQAEPEQPETQPDVTTALWNSPLLTDLQSRRVGGFKTGTLRNPQYVSGRTFARALVDLLVPAVPDGTPPLVVTIGSITDAVKSLPTSMPVRRSLLILLARAGTDVGAFERAVEQWYDEQMAKIAGWYKRWARVALGVAGFVVAALANVDTVQVAHALYVDAPVQQAVVATANAGALCQDTTVATRNQCAKDELASLQADGLPLGYSGGCHQQWSRCWAWSNDAPPHDWDLPLKVLGWTITAFAVSFGAPFWFEALSRLGSLRNAGTKPASTA
jgi:hypothetical protein